MEKLHTCAVGQAHRGPMMFSIRVRVVVLTVAVVAFVGVIFTSRDAQQWRRRRGAVRVIPVAGK